MNAYTVNYDGKLLVSRSKLCAEFEYDQDTKTIYVPYITTFGSQYAGQYTFMIRGANAEDTTIQSDALILIVYIGYDSSNQGPKLANEPKTLIAKKNKRTVFKVGQITDEEDDGYFLQEWSLSTEE